MTGMSRAEQITLPGVDGKFDPTSNLCAASRLRGPALIERRLISLDGWRGVAILLVFVRHYFLTTNAHTWWIKELAGVASAGWIGVDLFFVLSGFLITGILLDTRGHKRYFLNFYARRTLRIFPLYYGVLFGAFALTPLLHLQWRVGDITHFLYIDNISVQFNPALMNVMPWLNLDAMWSLAVEEQFYLLWPAIIFVIVPRKPLRWIAAFMGVAVLSRIGLLVLVPAAQAFEWSYKVLPMRSDALLCGAAAAVLFRAHSIEAAVRQLKWPAWIAATGLAAVLIHDHRLEFHSTLASVIVFPCLGIIFAWLLLYALKDRTWAHAIGSNSLLRFFGRYSYGMYVYHRLVNSVGLMRWLQTRLHSQAVGGIAYVVVIFAATTATAVISYELYEKHFLRLKRRFNYRADLS
jgi:peptidoglycan/LPS O-acetylase OafA/YrhL